MAEHGSRSALSSRFHALLGGGEGAPFAMQLDSATPRLLWSRSEKHGRSLMVIDLFALPTSTPFAWDAKTVHASEYRLTAAIPSDPGMEALLSSAEAPSEFLLPEDPLDASFCKPSSAVVPR